jgi:60 kDa SS-A/Ro ribonucleoprotein
VCRTGTPLFRFATFVEGFRGWCRVAAARRRRVVHVASGRAARLPSLDDAVRAVSDLPFGGTDCALPMLYAMAKERKVDTFAIYTDSETWAGDVHPAQALRDYRRASGIDARLVEVGMVSNGSSIADPGDSGMLDVVGFDTATPQLIADFARGAL